MSDTDTAGNQALADILAAVELGFDLEEYLAGVQHNGVSIDELELVAAMGLDRGAYLGDRRAGVAHMDVLDAYELRVDVLDYHGARQDGRTRSELFAAAEGGINLAQYSWARGHVAHSDLIAAAEAELDIWEYTQLRRGGISHEQVNEALAVGYTLDVCRKRLGVGGGHELAMAMVQPASLKNKKVPVCATRWSSRY